MRTRADNPKKNIDVSYAACSVTVDRLADGSSTLSRGCDSQ